MDNKFENLTIDDCLFYSAEEMKERFGLVNNSSFSDEGGKWVAIKTQYPLIVDGIEFLGRFYYKNNDFFTLELMPYTGIKDNYQSEEEITKEKELCEVIAPQTGKRIGRLFVWTKEIHFRDTSSEAIRYAIVGMPHPFFKDIEAYLLDSSMTSEEIVNFMSFLEDEVDTLEERLKRDVGDKDE